MSQLLRAFRSSRCTFFGSLRAGMESHAEDMTVLACKLCKLSSGKWYVRCVWAQAGLPELQELNRDALRGAVARSATVALFIVIVELKFELTTVTDTVTVTDTGSEEAQGGGR